MVTGNEIPHVTSRDCKRLSLCGNSKPVTTFAESTISATDC
jgi:hypothetical protein